MRLGLLSTGAVTMAAYVYFCSDLGPLNGSVAVSETVADCVLVGWYVDRLVGWLIGWLTS